MVPCVNHGCDLMSLSWRKQTLILFLSPTESTLPKHWKTNRCVSYDDTSENRKIETFRKRPPPTKASGHLQQIFSGQTRSRSSPDADDVGFCHDLEQSNVKKQKKEKAAAWRNVLHNSTHTHTQTSPPPPWSELYPADRLPLLGTTTMNSSSFSVTDIPPV